MTSPTLQTAKKGDFVFTRVEILIPGEWNEKKIGEYFVKAEVIHTTPKFVDIKHPLYSPTFRFSRENGYLYGSKHRHVERIYDGRDLVTRFLNGKHEPVHPTDEIEAYYSEANRIQAIRRFARMFQSHPFGKRFDYENTTIEQITAAENAIKSLLID